MAIRSHFALALLTVLMGASPARSGEPFEDEEELVFSELRAIRSKDLKARLAWLESISLNHPERVPKVARGLEPRDQWAAAWLARNVHQGDAGPSLLRAVVTKFPNRSFEVLSPHLTDTSCPLAREIGAALTDLGHGETEPVKTWLSRDCEEMDETDWGLLTVDVIVDLDKRTIDAMYAAGLIKARAPGATRALHGQGTAPKVVHVCRGSPAAALGLLPGDIIMGLNRKPYLWEPLDGPVPQEVSVTRQGARWELKLHPHDGGWKQRWVAQ